MVDRLETISWTYIVRCADGSLYTGWTKDLDKRLEAHNGQIPGGAKYTRTRRPVTLVWSQPFQSKRSLGSFWPSIYKMTPICDIINRYDCESIGVRK